MTDKRSVQWHTPAFFACQTTTSLTIDYLGILVEVTINICYRTATIAMPCLDDHPSMPLASQTECPFLTMLPPELGDQIYGYVFTTDESTPKDLVTARAQGPSSDLRLTCQRVFAETNGIYQSARTAYWSRTTFYVNRSLWQKVAPVRDFIKDLHDRELDLIQRIIISDEYNPIEWRLTTRRDNIPGWSTEVHTRDGDSTDTHTVGGRRSGLYYMLYILWLWHWPVRRKQS